MPSTTAIQRASLTLRVYVMTHPLIFFNAKNKNYTETGFKKVRAPEGLYRLLKDYFDEQRQNCKPVVSPSKLCKLCVVVYVLYLLAESVVVCTALADCVVVVVVARDYFVIIMA